MKKIEVGQLVAVARSITRAEGPYAEKGEVGIVEEIFCPMESGKSKIYYAKVRMTANKLIKTFRLTSLERMDS